MRIASDGGRRVGTSVHSAPFFALLWSEHRGLDTGTSGRTWDILQFTELLSKVTGTIYIELEPTHHWDSETLTSTPYKDI